jgi:hypothetical protein
MLTLPNVTIVCFSGTTPEQAVSSIKYSTQHINFAKKIVFSHQRPTNITADINFECIEKLSHHTYSKFILHELNNFIDTEFCLITHDDGFVINPQLWNDNFLSYDYIGAPWRAHYPHARVGNGGFSLRSKKFISLCQQLSWNGGHEDSECCIFNRNFFIKNGCKYAPIEVAMKFALESKIPECSNYSLDTCFGFHGRGTVFEVFEDGGQQFKDKIQLLNNF